MTNENIESETIQDDVAEKTLQAKDMSATKRIATIVLLEENVKNAGSAEEKSKAKEILNAFEKEVKSLVKKPVAVRKLMTKAPVKVEFKTREDFNADIEFARHMTKYAKYLNEINRWNRENITKDGKSKGGKSKFTVEVSKTEGEQFKLKVDSNNTNANQLLRSFIVNYINGVSMQAPTVSDNSEEVKRLNELLATKGLEIESLKTSISDMNSFAAESASESMNESLNDKNEIERLKVELVEATNKISKLEGSV